MPEKMRAVANVIAAQTGHHSRGRSLRSPRTSQPRAIFAVPADKPTGQHSRKRSLPSTADKQTGNHSNATCMITSNARLYYLVAAHCAVASFVFASAAG